MTSVVVEVVNQVAQVVEIPVVVGPPGPAGPAGATGSTYTQSTPLGTWSIAHSLGRLPFVAVYVAGEEVIADVTATTTNVSVAFAVPTAGVAVLI